MKYVPVANDLVVHTLQRLLVQRVLSERSAGRDHAAADIDAYGRGNDSAIGRNHRSHRGANAGMHIRHRGDVVIHDREPRKIDELLARTRFHVVGVHLHRHAPFFDDLLDRHIRIR